MNNLLENNVESYSKILLRDTELYIDSSGKVIGVRIEIDDFPSISVGDTSSYESAINYGSKLGILDNTQLVSKYVF